MTNPFFEQLLVDLRQFIRDTEALKPEPGSPLGGLLRDLKTALAEYGQGAPAPTPDSKRDQNPPARSALTAYEQGEDEDLKQAAFTCPSCKRTSYHAEDMRQLYCGACHTWFDGE